jgi:hypothetical protein
MSFMSGNTSNMPQRDQNALGVQTYRASTAEQARPVPFLVRQATPRTDVHQRRVRHEIKIGGRWRQGLDATGWNYYASFATLACHGPVDALYGIFLNGDPVYTDSVSIRIKTLTSAAGVATAETKNAHGLATGDERCHLRRRAARV